MPRVFISYAHDDEAVFAARLSGRLRAAGVDPWRDKEQIPPGERLNEALARAIKEVDCAIFLISPLWEDGNYGPWEIQQFTARDRSGNELKRIGIFRATGLGKPPELAAQLTMDWIDGETNDDAAFWQLYCGIMELPPGQEEEWESKGRELAATPPIPTSDRRSRGAFPGQSRASFFCDRGEQWNAVETMYSTPRHQLVFISGEEGEAHEFFIARVEEQLRRDPPAEFVHIDWPIRPASKEGYLEHLARALHCAADDLIRELQKRLRYKNVVLIHPCLDRYFDDDLLASYYTVWLPELLTAAKPQMRLKCIQPIEWKPGPGVVRTMRSIVGWGWLLTDEEREALSLIEAMEKQQPAPAPDRCTIVPAITIGLRPITENDVEQFFKIKQLDETARHTILGSIRAAKARTSYAILDAIDRFFARHDEVQSDRSART